jgi:integrase/recombinase XerD
MVPAEELGDPEAGVAVEGAVAVEAQLGCESAAMQIHGGFDEVCQDGSAGAAAHPAPGTSDYVFYSIAPGRPIDQSTVYLRFRGYLADAGIPHFTGGPHPHSLRHGFAVANLRRWAAEGTDLAVVLPYLACYMGHADLRGTQYYLRLTADAYPEVMARAQVRFGYVIPAPPGDEP